MSRSLRCTHGIVCRLPGERMGYFGWPTVACLDDDTLIVASSGLRSEHVCPWGKTVLNISHDNGRTWSTPQVINDSPLDDRDAGIVNLGGDNLLLSWFTSENQQYLNDDGVLKWLGVEEVDSWRETLASLTSSQVSQHLGSWIRLSSDRGVTWASPIRVPVSTPHGPIRLRNGDLLYLGKPFGSWTDFEKGTITACRSEDGGLTWKRFGQVPVFPGTDSSNYHEPHVVEFPDGRLLGMIRIENSKESLLENAGITSFSMAQTESQDGGLTWSSARPLGFHGSPPHLLRHHSGLLILTYGYRLAPFGQRIAFSSDEGTTWEHDWILREDGLDFDLGYPSTVELADGSLFTIYYQKIAGDRKCSILYSHWTLP